MLSALWLAGLGIVLAGADWGTRQPMRRLPRLRGQLPWQQRLTVVCVALCDVALLALSNPLVVPVPKGPAVPANAAHSLRSTADDLATFLIELGQPQSLAADLAAELRNPQVRVNADNSWGLGIVKAQTRQRLELWQGRVLADARDLIPSPHGVVPPRYDASTAVPRLEASLGRALTSPPASTCDVV